MVDMSRNFFTKHIPIALQVCSERAYWYQDTLGKNVKKSTGDNLTGLDKNFIYVKIAQWL